MLVTIKHLSPLSPTTPFFLTTAPCLGSSLAYGEWKKNIQGEKSVGFFFKSTRQQKEYKKRKGKLINTYKRKSWMALGYLRLQAHTFFFSFISYSFSLFISR